MSFLQFVRADVSNVMAGVQQQQQITSQLLDTIKGYAGKIQEAWTGDDSNACQQAILTKLVPAMVELIAAIAGVNLNLTKATNIVDQADAAVKKIAEGLGDLFNAIS